MHVQIRASTEVPRPLEATFDFATAADGFAKVLRPVPPIPGVRGAEIVGGGEPKTGGRRVVHMTDGSTVYEELLAWERPKRHRYRWASKPAFPFSLLVRAGEGDWHFSPAGTGTRIDWTYRFELTTPLVYPLALLVTALFRRWMQAGLDAIRAELSR